MKKCAPSCATLAPATATWRRGNLRADVNVSVRKVGGPLGTRCEIKNVNSYRFIRPRSSTRRAARSRYWRTAGASTRRPRLYDPNRDETRSMRSKEDAHDYRYFPDPDLLPLELDPAWVKAIQDSLPELPDDKRRRLMSQYGLSAYDATVLVIEGARADS
ncbi:MAG: hypothetical protein WDM85_01035 [Caulobacteraceae bacterium]